MSTGIWSAASGAVGKTNALEVAADNVANATTPGFRAETAVFRQTLVNAVDQARGTQSLRYAITRTNVPHLSPGQIVESSKGLDVAIPESNGFFVVGTSQGERYTRAGSFRLSSDGTLMLPDGATVLGENHRPIRVGEGTEPPRIDASGEVRVGNETVGKLLVVEFPDPSGLEKEGLVLMRALPRAGAPTPYRGSLTPESIELSNANPVEGMTKLISLSREFEMITKVIEAFSNIDRKAATDIASAR